MATTQQTTLTTSRSTGADTAALLTICVGFFMVSLDATAVNVALDALRDGMHTGMSGLQWTVDGYTLVFAALLLTAGALGDRHGPKRIFSLGLLVFSVASALCGLAPGVWALVAARVLQGAGAALLVSTSLSLLQAIYAEPAARARAFGVWGGVGGVAVAAGPVVGGILVTTLSWRSVFFLNVPLGLLGLVVARRRIPEAPGSSRSLNPSSQLAAVVGLGTLTYAFIEAGVRGWTAAPVLVAFLIAAAAVVVFLVNERRSATPMLPAGVFRNRGFTAACLVGLQINLGFYGQLFVVGLYFQQIRGYSAMETGLALLPQAVVASLTAFACGKVTARTGPRLPMLTGLVAGAVGLGGLAAAGAHTPYWLLVWPMMAIGFGISFTAPAATAAGMTAAPAARSGVTSGLLNAARQTGSVMGVAVLGALVGHRSGFLTGLHTALALAALFFLVALALTITWIKPAGHTPRT
ncbi:MFS transporter [Streptomyces sp. NPDC002536]